MTKKSQQDRSTKKRITPKKSSSPSLKRAPKQNVAEKKTASKKSSVKESKAKKSVSKKKDVNHAVSGTQDPMFSREAEKYSNPIHSREFILNYLDELGQPATRKQLTEEFGFHDEDRQEALRRRLIAMVRDGQLLMNRRGAYGPVSKMELIAGRVVGHKEGYGFLIPDDSSGDLFLTPQQMRRVFHGDRALVRASGEETRGKREAILVDVLERATTRLVGRFYNDGHLMYVEPSHPRITHDIFVSLDDAMNAEHGQMVIVLITEFPDRHHRARGRVIEILGDQMAPGMEINVAIHNHDLPNRWSDAVLEEAAAFPLTVTEHDIKGRRDIRDLNFYTIDGEDAKDFDDAVYTEKNGKNGYKLWVAIADVGHYVKAGSLLDQEAYLRGNSVYFPGRVIPMLPETLSNHLCSLKPKQDRLAMVCEMNISLQGRITRFEFYKAVICSKQRLTYNLVHELIEKKNLKLRKQHHAVIDDLNRLYDVYGILRLAREKRGAIDFNLPETKIVFDKNRKIQSIVPYERFESHKVIEECMLAANISAAKQLLKVNQPALYRVHRSPAEEKLKELRRFLNEMNLPFPVRKNPDPIDFSALLSGISGRVDAHLIQTVLLRSMSRAVYSPHNEGHFGLAYEAYTHFTSPIRRYPDLVVHRALAGTLSHHLTPTDLERMGEHCSMTERRADDATDEAKTWLKCEFMMDRVGESFDGIISSVTSFGLFVELKSIFIEGLIHISALPNDYYKFDGMRHTLLGERRQRVFRLGDPIRVTLARVDLDQQKIDFVLDEVVEPLSSSKQEKKKAKRKAKKKAKAAAERAKRKGR